MKTEIFNCCRGRSPNQPLYWLPNGFCSHRMMDRYLGSQNTIYSKPPDNRCATSEEVPVHGHELLVQAISERCNTDIDMVYNDNPSAMYAPLFSPKAKKLTPRDLEIMSQSSEDEIYPFPLPELSYETIAIPFTRQSWYNFFLDEMARYGLSRERCLPILKQPATLARFGYRLARITGSRRGVESREFTIALAIFGLGAIGLGHRCMCQFCFRVAVPWLSRCGMHSQSKGLHSDPSHNYSLQSQRARIGRRAAMAIQWPQNRPVEISGWLDHEPWTLAGLLWNTPWCDRSEILSELRAAPLVREKLPNHLEKLGRDRLLYELRAAIDPHEWLADLWPVKIKAAQMWFEAEASVAPGHPPKGLRKKTAERLAMAIQMLNDGENKSKVAKKLGISPSNLSHTLEHTGRLKIQ